MTLIRFDPFRELEDMSMRLNRLFAQPPARPAADDGSAGFADWAPAIDIQETDGEYLIKADLPEINKEDVRIEIHDGMLCMRGERKQEREEKGKKFHRLERLTGRFERRIAMPPEVDPQKIAAEFKDGVLAVHLPKSATAKPKSIEVKVA